MKLAQGGLDFEIQKKFEGMEFRDLYEFSTRVTRYELLLKKEAEKKNSSYGTYYQDFQDLDLEMEVDVAEVIGRMPFVCEALCKPNNPQDKNASPGSTGNNSDVMSINRACSIHLICPRWTNFFDHLLRGQFIQILMDM